MESILRFTPYAPSILNSAVSFCGNVILLADPTPPPDISNVDPVGAVISVAVTVSLNVETPDTFK